MENNTTTNPFLAAIQQMEALNTKPESIRTGNVNATGRVATILNPTGLKLRVFKDGRVLPGQELVDTFNLEYRTAEVVPSEGGPFQIEPTGTTITPSVLGNGIDMFLAWDLSSFPKSIPNGLLVTFTPKSEAKVDLFKTTEYNEDGTPKASVMTQFKQAASSFGKNSLIPMLEVLLNQDSSELFADKKYIDLEVNVEAQLPIAGDHLWIPKKVNRGPEKGKLQLSKRDKQAVMVLSIFTEEEETLSELGQSEQDTTSEEVTVSTEHLEAVN